LLAVTTTLSGTLSWADGDSSPKTFTVNITDDSDVENAESFTVNLANPTGSATLGTPNSATVTIQDNDTSSAGSVQFANASSSVAETAGTASVSVTRTGGSSGSVSVDYATSDGSATAGSDYSAATGTLSWADGDSSAKTLTVSINDDIDSEGNETLDVTLSNLTGNATLGSPSTLTLTIQDDDAATNTCRFDDANATFDNCGFAP
jgi:hypothetical protein